MQRARVLVAGDAHCGKTSLIAALQDGGVPERLPAIHAPLDLGAASLAGSSCTIIDSSAHPQDLPVLEAEIREADVVCLVYSADNPESYAHISSYWIPLVRRVLNSDGETNARPIIVACNKIDRNVELLSQASAGGMQSLIKTFQEIETCLECSAATLFNVRELFYFAQRAVVYPRAVLYHAHKRSLTAAAARALTRIFHLCDADRNGVLDDGELQAFQNRCFNALLSQEELRGVKEVVRHSTDHGVTAAGITCEGFLFLHRNFIERGMLETAWIVLRRFGYTDSLQLRDTLARPALPPGPCEFSEAGLEFIHTLFSSYDPSDAGVLLPAELGLLWADCDQDPWRDLLLPGSSGTAPPITRAVFLTLWRVLLSDNVTNTLELLATLGFALDDGPNATAATAVTVFKPSHFSRRSVFRVGVLGAPLCGKSTLIRGLADRGLLLASAAGVRAVVIASSQRGPVTLLVGEADEKSLTESHWDAFVLGFDQHDPASFGQVAVIGERLPPRAACVVVACKADLLTLPQDYLVSPADFCAARSLRPPLSSSDPAAIADALADVCVAPHGGPLSVRAPLVTKMLSAAAFLAALIAVFFAVRRANRR